MTAMETVAERPTVSVIVPARNEEACLGECLQSLVAQSGVTFEIIVVDDHSTDRTREIATSFPGVHVIDAGRLPAGWTGKNNAVSAGARAARGEWFLFTDADTVHLPGSLARALAEARGKGADLLSYSPEQILQTFSEKAVMPVIFAELASSFRPSDVSDPNSPAAAANGQYLLITRGAFDAVGGHAAIAGDLLEDVALARAVKQSGRRIVFRYGADAVRTRMYRNFAQLREGWTKNLVLLFPRAEWLAIRVLSLWLLAWIAPWAALVLGAHRSASVFALLMLIFSIPLLLLGIYIRRANAAPAITLQAMAFGPPLFAYLLWRSARAHRNGTVAWKNRTYAPQPALKQAKQPAPSLQRTENRELRTEN
jgi:glycosyltransferase involved in cell wall biosynthesis